MRSEARDGGPIFCVWLPPEGGVSTGQGGRDGDVPPTVRRPESGEDGKGGATLVKPLSDPCQTLVRQSQCNRCWITKGRQLLEAPKAANETFWPKLTCAEGTRKKFDWPKAQRKFAQSLKGWGGGGQDPPQPPPPPPGRC